MAPAAASSNIFLRMPNNSKKICIANQSEAAGKKTRISIKITHFGNNLELRE